MYHRGGGRVSIPFFNPLCGYSYKDGMGLDEAKLAKHVLLEKSTEEKAARTSRIDVGVRGAIR